MVSILAKKCCCSLLGERKDGGGVGRLVHGCVAVRFLEDGVHVYGVLTHTTPEERNSNQVQSLRNWNWT